MINKIFDYEINKRIVYIAKNGNDYPIDVYGKIVSIEDIVFEPEKMEKLCKLGCNNYSRSGGCPPLAPKFNDMKWEFEKFILICGRFDSIYKTEKVRGCSNRAIHWKFQDAILARFMDKIGRDTVREFGGRYLATGYCMGCPGKKCAIKIGQKCRNPQKRTFSMEATGINVVKTVKNNLNLDFHWYAKNNIDVPYMMKTILYNSQNIKNAEKYICSLDNISYIV